MKGLKSYIGDGVYVKENELGIVLTTEDGVRVTNTIVLEWEILEALAQHVREAINTQLRTMQCLRTEARTPDRS